MRILTFIFFIFSFNSSADYKKILSCIAREELSLHKKQVLEYEYKINQLVVNYLSEQENFIFIEESTKNICSSKKPALKFIYEVLDKKENIFETKLLKNTSSELIDYAASLFISYISFVQADAKVANCLTKNIPEIKTLMDNYKYLQLYQKDIAIIENQKIWKAIMKKLEAFNLKKCVASLK